MIRLLSICHIEFVCLFWLDLIIDESIISNIKTNIRAIIFIHKYKNILFETNLLPKYPDKMLKSSDIVKPQFESMQICV